MNNFRELSVWKKNVVLTTDIYEATRLFPSEERFNLVSQMQRAAISIPGNIAEGAGRHTNALYKQFLAVALGSCYELETQLVISNNLNYLKVEDCKKLTQQVVEIQKMIHGLSATL